MISIIPYSKKALLIQWDGPIQRNTISEVNRFNQLLLTREVDSITETIPAFNSITVCFDDTEFSELKWNIEYLYSSMHSVALDEPRRIWHLPMLPSQNYPHDISDITKVNSQHFYDSFFKVKFMIGMKGFLPGFMYLAGLPESMHIPRKSTPDLNIAKGSIAIGGAQCGIYPKASPGGWHIIGNCPIPLINFNDPNLSCFKIGDEVQFIAIDKAQHVLYQTTQWNLELITSKFSKNG